MSQEKKIPKRSQTPETQETDVNNKTVTQSHFFKSKTGRYYDDPQSQQKKKSLQPNSSVSMRDLNLSSRHH